MTPSDLVKAISLDPRAVVLTGSLRERTKNSDSGTISGYTPHYTVRGCPVAQFGADGEFSAGPAEGTAIESDFTEQARPESSAIMGSYGRALNMVHLLFGRQGTGPNSAEAKVLKEAGEIFRRLAGQPIYLVALPIFSSGQYGVAQGRLFPLGCFSPAGEPLWLNPATKGSWLKADYPAAQLQRSTTPAPPAPAPAPAPSLDWYEMTSNTLAKATKLSGAKLHNLVISTRADNLFYQGAATTKDAALALAKDQYAAAKASKASITNSAPLPAPKTTQPTRKLTSARL